MVKQAKASGEESKVALRNQRHKVLDFIKKQIKNGFPEDIGKKKEDDVQKIIDNYVHKIDKVIEVKEKDILTI